MSRYIPMPAYPDMMPVDISFVFENEKPAGKHGFVRADGEDLRFEDGTLAKFWGVNFNGGACFPDKEYAPKVARRLAQAGCNMVRFHQLDAEWDTPNLFAFTKGKRVTTTRVMDARSLDALDYLVYCLKEEGIYCYLDMITYRKFKEGDGVPEVEKLQDCAKPWSITSPCLIELQKEFADQIWNHYNPYTKLAYKDDPVFALTEITNETDLFVKFTSTKVDYVPETYYINEFRQFFKQWLEEQGIDYDWENCDLYAEDECMLQFKMYMTKKYYREMYDYMRGIGVKVPIAGTNWSKPVGAFLKAHEDMDFTDAHKYFYDWRWGNNERICGNKPITAAPYVFTRCASIRMPEKPMFISEWDMPWPNSYRAEGPIYFAALGALQNWAGFTVHTYSYSCRLSSNSVLGRELSGPVAGVPYREGIFSVWNDPAIFGLFYHAALMFRRQDIAPANKKVAISHPMGKISANAYNGLLEQHRAASVFDDKLPEGYTEMVQHDEKYPHPTPGMIMSDNGQMWRDQSKNVGAVDTPRTKIVYGSLGRGSGGASHKKSTNVGISLDGVNVKCTTDFGVVAISSLTDAPIESSDNMLLSAIGRARNTDPLFDGEKMLEVGKPPIMAEVVEADVQIKTDIGDRLKVWGVNAEGFYAGKLLTTYEDGWLSFHIGDTNNPACYYLIVKE